MQDLRQRLYTLKTIFFAVVTATLGLAILFLARFVEVTGQLPWLRFWPLNELGSTLFITGLVVVAFDFWDGKDKEARDTERLTRVLKAEAPAIRDAVIDGFAFKHDDLARVATPETLDQIIRNSLALRLKDESFATEVYEDIRDQAIAAPERRHDARVVINLSPLSMDRASAEGGSIATGTSSLFVVTVQAEYTVVPKTPVHRFACVSDPAEYDALTAEPASTTVWHMKPKDGVDAGTREAFELVQFSVDGVERTIRRSTRKGGQTYTADIGREAIHDGKPVTVSYTYRTVTARDGHLLYFDIEQPTRGVDIQLDYSGCGIGHVEVLDFIASSHKARVSRTPASVPGKSVSVGFDGWVFPRSGVAFVWGLGDESRNSSPTR